MPVLRLVQRGLDRANEVIDGESLVVERLAETALERTNQVVELVDEQRRADNGDAVKGRLLHRVVPAVRHEDAAVRMAENVLLIHPRDEHHRARGREVGQVARVGLGHLPHDVYASESVAQSLRQVQSARRIKPRAVVAEADQHEPVGRAVGELADVLVADGRGGARERMAHKLHIARHVARELERGVREHELDSRAAGGPPIRVSAAGRAAKVEAHAEVERPQQIGALHLRHPRQRHVPHKHAVDPVERCLPDAHTVGAQASHRRHICCWRWPHVWKNRRNEPDRSIPHERKVKICR
mmetsp:Transcript_26153/g.54943  ORF Transcript_26153/g.54943 Transcript_26153/m.54943 type:complete len:298 (-) Transcript_26153:504-1397(-)